MLTDDESNHIKLRLEKLINQKRAFEKDLDRERLEGEKVAIQDKIDQLDQEIERLQGQLKAQSRLVHTPDEWQSFFQQHDVRAEGARIMTVDCNRESFYDIDEAAMYNHFHQHRTTAANIVYFLTACPFQRPLGIAKRLVYDIEEDYSVCYLSDQNSLINDALTFNLRADPDKSWQKYWRLVQDRMPQANGCADPQAYAEACGKDYIALLLRVTEDQWRRPNAAEHLRCLLQQFAEMPPPLRKYLLFISIELPRLHLETGSERWINTLNTVSKLCAEYNAPAAGMVTGQYDLMPPVNTGHIEGWATKHLPGHYALQNLCSAISDKLSKLCADTQHGFDMEYVETMQLAAYKHAVENRTAYRL